MSSSEVISRLESVLEAEGVHAGLRFLNARTPHRFTGIYRYDGDMLRNVYLFDQFDPSSKKGDDVKMEDAYCALVGERFTSVEFADIAEEDGIPYKPDSPVVSYCGALITDEAGKPFGTLCHFDIKPAEARSSDSPIVEAAAPLIFRMLKGTQAIEAGSAAA